MELHNIKNKASDDGRFSISVKKWTEQTNAIGINAKSGRYNSGTYAVSSFTPSIFILFSCYYLVCC